MLNGKVKCCLVFRKTQRKAQSSSLLIAQKQFQIPSNINLPRFLNKIFNTENTGTILNFILPNIAQEFREKS